MSIKQIESVKDNFDKQKTYASQMARYKLAMKHEFYCEAIMIDYAVLEDRLRSILYYMGFLPNRKSINVWEKARPIFLEIVRKYKREDENDNLGIKNISSKIKIVRSILLWTANVEGGYQEDKHLKALKLGCESLDIDGVLSCLSDISEWCDYRNEIVHALMNKNLDSIQREIQIRAE